MWAIRIRFDPVSNSSLLSINKQQIFVTRFNVVVNIVCRVISLRIARVNQLEAVLDVRTINWFC